MKAYKIVLDGDNLIGLAFTDSVEKAIELGMKNCWAMSKDSLTATLVPSYGEKDSEFFVSKDMMRHFYNYTGD